MNFIRRWIYKLILHSYHRYYQASIRLGKEGRYDEGLESVRNALRILQRVDPRHPGIGQCYQNMATLYVGKKNYAEAENFYKQALPILEKHLGPTHRHTAQCIKGLAVLYSQTNRPRLASEFKRRYLKIVPHIHDRFPTRPPEEIG